MFGILGMFDAQRLILPILDVVFSRNFGRRDGQQTASKEH